MAPLLAVALLAASPPPGFTGCELGQRFGPAAVSFSCEAHNFECPKAGGGSGCTDALCGGAHSHAGCSCAGCRQRSNPTPTLASSNFTDFTCACAASSGCACQITPPPPPPPPGDDLP
eukprot:COSAG04_NODE_2336_length_4308_cov_1.870516_5_plen_118_part_00